ncbi:unnamed protein product, partial [Mesorhabditis belari]|uniref:non-specific serine/threonine protein kinase n=1 Tax=Mesorhabditis belari TaxID=2138241 RepID=A0AAF3FF54_9BILA
MLDGEIIGQGSSSLVVVRNESRPSKKKIIYDRKYVYSIKTVLIWAKQLFSALSYLHQERKIVHRDVKPANIFVSKDFVLKLGDFGCVRQLEATSTGTLVGTQRYMSPRTVDKEEPYKVSKRNDVYGAGLVLWEMVERRVVFDEYTRDKSFDANNFYIDIFTKKLTALEPPDCFDELKELIGITTNFDQKQRPSASRVLAQLKEIIEENDDFLEQYAFAP